MTRIEYRVLGALAVLADGQPVRIGGPRQQTVLAMLLLSANEVVPIDRLIDAVWDDVPPQTARNQIHTCVSTLRSHLRRAGAADVIRTHPAGYLMTIEDGQLDIKTFELLTVRGRAAGADGQLAEAADLLHSALACWKGNALAALDSRLIRSAAAGLDEERLAVLEERIELDLGLGRHAETVGELTGLVSAYPLREQLRSLHMLALCRSGRQAEALESFRVLRRILRKELGLEPNKVLKELEHAILTDDESVMPPHQPLGSRPGRPEVPRQLPAAIADFTGHAQEISDIVSFISAGASAVPIVSVFGVGGAGKTALVVRVAHQLSDRFPDGQIFAVMRSSDAQPVSTMRLLERFLRALGGPDLVIPVGLEERILAYRSMLGNRKVLLILDDADSAEQVLPLIPGNPDCTVIVTSRRSLPGLYGCREWELGPLDQDSCMALLAAVMGAGRVRREKDSAAELVRLCTRLPLAVRIIAAKLATRPHWSIAQMVRRLADEQRRLDEIALGNSGIRSCISISYRNLSASSKSLLLRLGMLGMKDFPSWVSAPLLDLPLPMAEDVLAALVEERLVEITQDIPGHARFRVHDLVRLYAAERSPVDEAPEESLQAVQRMLGCWLGLAAEAHRRTYGGDFFVLHGRAAHWALPSSLVDELLADPLKWMHAERDGLIAAVFHAQQARLDELCWDLTVTLVTLFESEHLVDDWRSTHQAALEVVRERENARGEAALLCSLGMLEALEGSGQAREYLRTAHAAFAAMNDHHGEALALQTEGFNDRLNGDYDSALDHSARSLAGFRAVDDPVGEVGALNNMAQVFLERQETGRALELLYEALAKSKELGVGRIRAQTEYRLGETLVRVGEPEIAADCFASAVRLSREGHDLLGEAYGLYGLGVVAITRQDQAAGEAHLMAALELAERLDHSLLLGRVLPALNDLTIGRGRPLPTAEGTAGDNAPELEGSPDHALIRALRMRYQRATAVQ